MISNNIFMDEHTLVVVS